jgi:hypothetical protein
VSTGELFDNHPQLKVILPGLFTCCCGPLIIIVLIKRKIEMNKNWREVAENRRARFGTMV